MKVLHVYKEFHPDRSGVARHIDGLARHSRSLGIDAAVYAQKGHARHPELDITIGDWRGLISAVRRADVLHLHGARTPITAFAGLLAQLLGRPFLYTPHCYYDSVSPLRRMAKRIWDRIIERRLLIGARATILLDEVWLEYLATRHLPVAHPVIVPNCVLAEDVLARRPAEASGKLTGSLALLSIGRLVPVKRLGDIIAALALPGLEGTIFHIIGEGETRRELEQQAIDLGVGDRVVFHGGCDDLVAARMTLGADVFVLPSEREGGPTAVIEALMFGCPVIASDIPGTRAILAKLATGSLVPLGDISAWAAALTALPLPVTEAVHSRLLALYSWEARAADIVALYQRGKEPPA
ncbi:glycosyltransferase family 4 protein [Lacibacterium aquatile]|uniref:Glycosyltransferase family 4 protein n=1 Tax=Lacibacterium aquatile TaxID=1168082 RepID=A0ABW5DUV8_9PROT